MKKWKKWVSLFVAFSILLGLGIGVLGKIDVEGDSTEHPFDSFDYITVDYLREGSEVVGGIPDNMSFTYNDGMLLEDSNTLSPELAKVSVALSIAAYDRNRINDVLSQMGFPDDSYDNNAAYYRTDHLTYDDNDAVAYTVAHKTIMYHGEEYVFFCVPVKGTGENAEWYSDFNVGTGDTHRGFSIAAQSVYGSILDQIDQYSPNDPNHTIVLLTGHSRGAAVANLVSGWLTENDSSSVASNHIFGYTFACPSVSKKANTRLRNIYNFNNPNDLIPLLPLENWGYKRYGQTIKEMGFEKDNFIYQYEYYNNNYSAKNLREEDYLETLLTIFPTQADFETREAQFLAQTIAYGLGGKTQSEYKEVLEGTGAVYFLAPLIIAKLTETTLPIAVLTNIAFTLASKSEIEIEALIYIDRIDKAFEAAAKDPDELHDAIYHFNHDVDSLGNHYNVDYLGKHCRMTVSTASDLITAREILVNEIECISYIRDHTGNGLKMIFDENGNVKSHVEAGHAPHTYILWINSLFCGCMGWANYDFKNQSFDLPATIRTVDFDCFRNSKNLKNLYLNDKLRYVGAWAFYDADIKGIWGTVPLTTVGYQAFAEGDLLPEREGQLVLTEPLRFVGGSSFENCQPLTGTVEFSDTITDYEDDKHTVELGIHGCKHINKVILPNTIKGIYGYAFSGCTSLSEITLPGEMGVTRGFFYGIPNIRVINVTGKNLSGYFVRDLLNQIEDNDRVVTVNLEEGITTIGYDSASVLENIQTKFRVNAPSTLEEIGEAAFQGSTGLQNIPFTSEIKRIGNWAFQGCSSMKGALDFQKLEYLGAGAFNDCVGLSKVAFSPTAPIESIGAFNGCTGLTELSLPSSLKRIEDGAFAGCSGLKGTLVLGKTIEYIGQAAFIGCNDISRIELYEKSAPNMISDSFPDSAEIHCLYNATGYDDYEYDDGYWHYNGVRVIPDLQKPDITVALTSSKGTNLIAGTQTTLKANVNSDTGRNRYKFIVFNNDTNQWYKIRDFEYVNTCEWYTGGAGKKTLYVDVKDRTGAVVREKLDVTVSESAPSPLMITSFDSSKGTSLTEQTNTALSATATGGKAPYTYKFIVYNQDTRQWYKIRDFASSNTCDWYTGPVGAKNLYVDVKDGAGTVVRQQLNVTVSSPLAASTFSSSKGTNLKAKDTTTLTAQATGGSGSGYTYKFIVYNTETGQWFKIQDYSTKKTASWYTGTAGKKILYLDIKDSAGNYVRTPLNVTVK